MAKNKKVDGFFFIIMIILLPFFWLYAVLGKALFWSLTICCIGGGIYFYQKRKKEQHTANILSENSQHSSSRPKQTKSGNREENWRNQNKDMDQYALQMVSYPVGDPDSLPSAYNLFTRSVDFDGQRASVLRNLQILRDSLDIVKCTPNQATAESRLKLAYDNYESLDHYAYLFTQNGFSKLNQHIKHLFIEVHQVMYINIADRHIEKMILAKTNKTQLKYQNLALEVLNAGLTDQLSDHEAIQRKILSLHHLVQNKA